MKRPFPAPRQNPPFLYNSLQRAFVVLMRRRKRAAFMRIGRMHHGLRPTSEGLMKNRAVSSVKREYIYDASTQHTLYHHMPLSALGLFGVCDGDFFRGKIRKSIAGLLFSKMIFGGKIIKAMQ